MRMIEYGDQEETGKEETSQESEACQESQGGQETDVRWANWKQEGGR